MTSLDRWAPPPSRVAPLVVASIGVVLLLAGIAVGDRAVAFGAVAFLLATLVALGESYRPILTWRSGVVLLILVIWLIPIKKYRLPINLPFDLEPYRLLILALVFAWILAFISGRVKLSAGGQRAPLLLLAVASIGALLANIGQIADAGLQTQSIKSLSYFLSFMLAFLLVGSVLRTYADVNAAIKALVVGGFVVGGAAIYERQSGDNLFNHLHSWLPFLEFDGQINENIRAGRLRVRSSAQHPIALGAALVMCLPLALYLARAASTKARSALWGAGAVLLLIASLATISRTVVLMLIAVAATGVLLRRRELLNRETLYRLSVIGLFVLVFVQIAAPGSVRTLYAAFTPQGGLIEQQQVRAGEEGSGRIADLGPALDLWLEQPMLGRSLGTDVTRADSRSERTAVESTGAEPGIIFVDQYLHTLVYLGIIGLVGVLWFVWGTVRKLARTAKRLHSIEGDLLVACAAACAGFGVSLAVFDAFAFVQSSLLFFVIAALGLRVRSLNTTP
jgi:hypothetical protein